MERYDIFQDIAERTGGDIYIGVVGPVRTGKSTFIKRFMEMLVIPNISNVYDRERSQDELPQSGSGRTIMTTEPKFVPSEAVEVRIADHINFRVRMVDCVGYAVGGAAGYEDMNGPRMVLTPWRAEPVSFVEAAEMGTQKVINDHSTVGLVITTDGSITEIVRDDYLPAEERVIGELKALGKPFVVIVNSTHPEQVETQELVGDLQQKHQVPVLAVNCLQMSSADIESVLQELLYMFPVREVQIDFPKWVEELSGDHWLRSGFENGAYAAVSNLDRVCDVEAAVDSLRGLEEVQNVRLDNLSLGNGSVRITLETPPGLFYRVLEEISGFAISGDHHLMRLIRELSVAKREYDKVAVALQQVHDRGYGVVQPLINEMTLAEPELIKHGNRFGVKLKASAPSIHMIKVDIMTEISPIVGTAKQGEEFLKYLTDEFEKDPSRIWQTDFFGKSMNDLVKEGIQSKLAQMPENAQEKLQETLTKILNEGSGGLICIIL